MKDQSITIGSADTHQIEARFSYYLSFHDERSQTATAQDIYRIITDTGSDALCVYDRRNKTKVPLPEYTQQIRAEREAMLSAGYDEKKIKQAFDKRKQQLPCVAWSCVMAPKREADYATSHSGLICVDFDGLDYRKIEALDAELRKDQHTNLMFVSPSLTGLKLVVPVSGLELWLPANVQAQAERNRYLKAFHARAVQVVWDNLSRLGVAVDEVCKDISRLCFLCHDEFAYFNPKALPLAVPPPTEAELKTIQEAPTETARKKSTAMATEKPTRKETKPRQAEHKHDDDWATVKDCLEHLRDYHETFTQSGQANKFFMTVCNALGGHFKDTELNDEVRDYCVDFCEVYKEDGGVWAGGCFDRANGDQTLRSIYWHGWQHGWRKTSDGSKNMVPVWAEELAEKLPPVLCVGEEWFAYTAGVWSPVEVDGYRPIVVNVLGESHTHRRVCEVMDAFCDMRQVPRSQLRSFHCFDGENTVLLNVQNGLLRVTPEKVELLPHNAELHFTQKTAAAYDIESRCDLFLELFNKFVPEEDDRELVFAFAGYLLYPDSKAAIALYPFGPTGSGKNTIFDNALAAALGDGLKTYLGLSELCNPTSYSTPMLQHSALNLGAEAPQGEIPESQMFKMLVEGSTVPARRIYGPPFDMSGYTTKFIFLGNHMPRFKNGTDAEGRRLRFVHMHVQVPEDDQDPRVKDKLAAGIDGILTHFMIPALQCLLSEFKIPKGSARSRELMDMFNLNVNPLGAFLAQYCDLKGQIAKGELVRAWLHFLAENNLSDKLGDERQFFRQLKERKPELKNYRPSGGDRVRQLIGISLKPQVSAMIASSRPERETDANQLGVDLDDLMKRV